MGRGINVDILDTVVRKIHTELTFKKRPKGFGYLEENSRQVQKPRCRRTSGVHEGLPGGQRVSLVESEVRDVLN